MLRLRRDGDGDLTLTAFTDFTATITTVIFTIVGGVFGIDFTVIVAITTTMNNDGQRR